MNTSAANICMNTAASHIQMKNSASGTCVNISASNVCMNISASDICLNTLASSTCINIRENQWLRNGHLMSVDVKRITQARIRSCTTRSGVAEEQIVEVPQIIEEVRVIHVPKKDTGWVSASIHISCIHIYFPNWVLLTRILAVEMKVQGPVGGPPWCPPFPFSLVPLASSPNLKSWNTSP